MSITKEELMKMPRIFQKDFSEKLKEITVMDDPILSPYPFIYFTCNRNPDPTDSTYSGYPGLIYFWYNTTSTNVFCCTDCSTAGALVWQEMAMPQNILGMLDSVGWEINTARSYVQRTSPAFGTSYTPSATNDTEVTATVDFTSTLLAASQINIQINSGSGFVTIADPSVSGIAGTVGQTITFTVPAGSSYQLVNVSNVGASASITLIMELTS